MVRHVVKIVEASTTATAGTKETLLHPEVEEEEDIQRNVEGGDTTLRLGQAVKLHHHHTGTPHHHQNNLTNQVVNERS